jgi:predicted acyl esterase
VTDLYREALWHGGILNQSFAAAWATGVGVFARRSGSVFRTAPARAVWKLLRTDPLHRRFERVNGETVFGILAKTMRARYDAHPWDDLFFEIAVGHHLDDEFWRERNAAPLLPQVEIPVYLGSDWDNVTLELPGVFSALEGLPATTPVRAALMGRGGLTCPWESLHVEALAWFDQWLKGEDTGILDGPPLRYWLPGADTWQATADWPPAGMRHVAVHLRADRRLASDEGPSGERDYLFLPPGLRRLPNANPPTLPRMLTWEKPPAERPYDILGPAALELDAATTAGDADWIVKLELVAPDGAAHDLTQGWLRASHRALDETRSRPGRPYHLHTRSELVEPGALVHYTIGIVPTAQHVLPGCRLRLLLTSSDLEKGFAMAGMTHLPLGAASRQLILSSSRLLLPVID